LRLLGADARVRLTITVTDWGASAKAVWDKAKATSMKGNWLVGDEAGMGTYAYGELIRRSARVRPASAVSRLSKAPS